MKTLKLLSVICLVALITLSIPTMAQNKGQKGDNKGKKEQNDNKGKKSHKEIKNLKPEQKEKIKTINDAYKPEAKKIKTELKTMVENHRNLVKTGADINQLYSSLEKISTKELELRKLTAKRNYDIRAVLDDNQKKEWDDNNQENELKVDDKTDTD